MVIEKDGKLSDKRSTVLKIVICITFFMKLLYKISIGFHNIKVKQRFDAQDKPKYCNSSLPVPEELCASKPNV